MKKFFAIALGLACLGGHISARAQDSAPDDKLRQTLGERIPQLKDIDDVRPTPMPGLFEVRMGTDIFYTDATGDFVIQGELIDTRARRNLTEDRIGQLTAVAFADLPVQDAITIVRGKGERKLAVFQDPNCGYCKRFERDLKDVDNVTIHLFLYPILSPSSAELSRDIWCAADPAAAWAAYMLDDQKPLKPAQGAKCDTAALQRNLGFGRKYKITGTPTLIFADDRRVPGIMKVKDLEAHMDVVAGR